jgi:lipid II:glycine glycyltransferase (peptidoglycan interpeptide bridge formation enzyme)
MMTETEGRPRAASLHTGNSHSAHASAQVYTNPDEWDWLLARHGGGLLQSWRWGEFKAATGWSALRLASCRTMPGHPPLIGGQVLFRSVPRIPLPVSIAYVPRGPVYMGAKDLAHEQRLPLEAAFWASVHEQAGRRGAIFLKVEPDIELGEHLTKDIVDGWMATLGFRPAGRLQPARTIVLDLDKSEDELLKAMKPKTRYNLRLAGRRGVLVRRAETLADLHAFYKLLEITSERDRFGIHTFPYYKRLWAVFGPEGSNTALVLLADHPDEVERAQGPIAGLLTLRFGREAIYMYGASDNRGREHMPNYLLQWEAIRWARQQGCARYDFWGIPDAPAQDGEEGEVSPINARAGLRGVYWFKKGFGGREIAYPGAYDYVYRPLLYRIWMRWRGADLG